MQADTDGSSQGPTVAPVLEFGPFRLDARGRRLHRGPEALPVSPRAFDVLVLLVERAGQTVTKAELMRRVWPDVFVEEANIAQHVSQLRRLLGDTSKLPSYIATIPRQGYQFVGLVRPPSGSDSGVAGPATAGTQPIGRFVSIALGVVVVGLAMLLPRLAGAPLSSSHPAAMAEYQRGRFLLAQNTPDSAVHARQAFEDAVRLDPGFAEAQADLALAAVSLFLARRVPLGESLQEASAAVDAALAVDPRSAEAHMAQGAIFLQLRGHPVSAERELRRATMLEPNNLMALDLLTRALRQQGRFDESVAVARRALASQPTSVRAHMNVVQSLLFSGQHLDEAGDLCRRALVLEGTSPTLFDQAADVADAAGRFDDAIRFRAAAERARQHPEFADLLGISYREHGYAAAMSRYLEARLAALDQGRADRSMGFERGRLLTRLGRIDEAFSAFFDAADSGFSVGVMALKYHPAYRALTTDSRFRSLEARAVSR